MEQTVVSTTRVVRIIEPTISVRESAKTHYRVLRVAAYCRVSTKQEEQLNSYENQVEHYTERINSENGWTLEGIYADKGISGTNVKNRDEFNHMIRRCKQGKIDMIITKSIARFARNTVDCLKYARLLNELGVDVYFEEQGIKSPTGKAEWQFSTIQSILSNERYKGNAIINKTYITDCISKKVRVNNGERPKYYVENSHLPLSTRPPSAEFRRNSQGAPANAKSAEKPRLSKANTQVNTL